MYTCAQVWGTLSAAGCYLIIQMLSGNISVPKSLRLSKYIFLWPDTYIPWSSKGLKEPLGNKKKMKITLADQSILPGSELGGLCSNFSLGSAELFICKLSETRLHIIHFAGAYISSPFSYKFFYFWYSENLLFYINSSCNFIFNQK